VEAVENHTPEVIIIDEIGTEAECAAARTIAQRGVCVCVDQQALGRGGFYSFWYLPPFACCKWR